MANFHQKKAHIAPGLGWRNRSQRLAEYAQRRADVLGIPSRPASPLSDVTNSRKRRRFNVDFEETKKAGGAELAVIMGESRKMKARTILFGIVDPNTSKIEPR